jgi:transposase-like protein
MGQVRRGSTTTTHAVRAAKRRSQASLARPSWELGINPKTVAKWRKRATVEDMKTGPSEPRSTVLTATEKTMVVAFSRHTRLPPDDGLYALQRFHDDSHHQLRTHFASFLAAYNFDRRLKTLGSLTPYEYICKIWTSDPDRFILDPINQMPGLNT